MEPAPLVNAHQIATLLNPADTAYHQRYSPCPAGSSKRGILMIHHVSIPAREPQRVAEVLAELMGGKCFPFGPLEGAFMAASDRRAWHDD